jgi:hypothetical protein
VCRAACRPRNGGKALTNEEWGAEVAEYMALHFLRPSVRANPHAGFGKQLAARATLPRLWAARHAVALGAYRT